MNEQFDERAIWWTSSLMNEQFDDPIAITHCPVSTPVKRRSQLEFKLFSIEMNWTLNKAVYVIAKIII